MIPGVVNEYILQDVISHVYVAHANDHHLHVLITYHDRTPFIPPVDNLVISLEMYATMYTTVVVSGSLTGACVFL